MSLTRHRRAWEDLGRIDPLWAVLSSATRRHGRWDPAEFFATGEREIAALMKSADELSLPRERGVVLDFGCGVGRVARPLASHFENYIGVDISQPMIEQAGEWNRDCTRCRFVLNTTGDLRAFESASIDLVYTKKVLQHLPTQGIVRSYLSELVRILRPGGLLVFQLPRRIGLFQRLQPQRRLYTALRGLGISERLLLGRLKLLPMQMRSMPEAEVVGLLTMLGARVVRIDHTSDVNQVYFVSRLRGVTDSLDGTAIAMTWRDPAVYYAENCALARPGTDRYHVNSFTRLAQRPQGDPAMATATRPVSPHAAYPAEALQKLFAPPETEQPADKLRRLLHEARAAKSYVHTAGAYDAFTAAIMTRLGFKALYGSGWQLAATKSMFPDIGVYASHDMVKLVHEMWMGIEGARNTHYYDTDGKEVLEAPPSFVDMEAGFGGPTQTFTLAVELIRARAGGVHLENQDPANRTCGHIVNVGKQKRNKVLVPRKDWLAKLKAIKAASQATGIDVVIIARTDSIDGALPDREPGGVKMAVEDAWEAAELGVDVIWPEFNNTELEQPQEFAEGVRKYYPEQMLGFNLSPSLYFGKAKKAGTLITNQQLADLGFILQFSTLFNFRTAGMALEKGLRKFLKSGIDALADLQIEEDELVGTPPSTKMHQKFAGMNRWLILEQVLSGGGKRD